MSPSLRNPLALLAFSALCVIGAVALLLTGHPAPGWLQTLCAAGLAGGAAVMTPGLPTVDKLLGAAGAVVSLGAVAQPGKQADPGNTPGGGAVGPLRPVTAAPTVGLTASDLEPTP